MTGSDYAAIRVQVEQTLPLLLDLSDEELQADVGIIALNDAHFARRPAKSLLRQAGRQLVETDQRVRHAVCDPQRRGTLTDVIDVTNVTALVGIIAPTLGFPPTTIPSAVL